MNPERIAMVISEDINDDLDRALSGDEPISDNDDFTPPDHHGEFEIINKFDGVEYYIHGFITDIDYEPPVRGGLYEEPRSGGYYVTDYHLATLERMDQEPMGVEAEGVRRQVHKYLEHRLDNWIESDDV